MNRPLASPRIPSLDGLRTLSIALVCLAHFSYSSGFPIHHNSLLDHYAHYGVRIFFVISGFLITSLLINEHRRTGRIDLKHFFIRRAYRILPVAYVYLVVITVLFRRSLSNNDFVLAYSYLSSYSVHLPWILSHLWSLSVEEQFYLIWPIAMAFSFALARRFVVAAIIFAPIFRLLMDKLGFPLAAVYFFPSVADSLAAGCLLAILQPQLQRHRSLFTWRGFPFIWIFTLSVPIVHTYAYVLRVRPLDQMIQVFSLSVFNLGIALCVQNAIVAAPRLLNTSVVVWIGTLSYSLYLWQMPFTNPDVRSWATTFPQNLILALLTAVISFYAVERPVLRIRARRYRFKATGSSIIMPSRPTRGIAA